jgi:hypothetical protein
MNQYLIFKTFKMQFLKKNCASPCAPAPLRLTLLALLFTTIQAFPQYLPIHPQTNNIYSFLNEFNLNYNPTIKTLGRQEISTLLTSLDTSQLTSRQQKELAFYLKDFNKEVYPNKNFPRRLDLFYHRDSSFSITINPIGGGTSWINKNGFEYHWWNGAEATASIGKFGFYASLRDNHLSSALYSPSYLDQQPAGSNFKGFSDGKTDFEEIRGGVTYAWKTGHVGLMKDNFEWGTNYNGANIFSGHTPAFVHLDFRIKPVKWFEFNYTHGWLNSEVVDSSRSFWISNAYGSTYRQMYHSKFMAANMFSFFPVQKLSVSVGNSVIYDYGNLHPAYLIPFMFFKAVDHNLSSGIDNMNSQMFLDISSKNINHLHLYSTLFIDELAIKRIKIKDEHNFASLKAGLRVSNLIPNVFAGMEYTITNALTFKHYITTTTFESNRYNLGHYLTDNAKELYLTLGWKPIRNMTIQLSYTDILKGPDHTSLGTVSRDKITPFVPIVYESQILALNISWQLINDLFFNLGFIHKNVSGDPIYLQQFSPEFWWGETNSLNIGLNYGF